MKTRSNMPLFVVECNNVKTLSNSQIDLLRCGDYLVKKDASGEHAYKVTFKSATGMCITYHDAYCVETQSYDKIDGVWTYNSEDKVIIAEPSFENIVDSDGHKRFIEGDITIETIEGMTQTYGKWSLSGTHLMLVIVGSTSANFSLPDNTVIANISLPEWIRNKIVAGSFALNTFVCAKPCNFFTSSYAITTKVLTLIKTSTGLTLRNSAGSQTITNASEFRLEFDLLIDNE